MLGGIDNALFLQNLSGFYAMAIFILFLAHVVMSEKTSKTLRTNNQEWRRVMSVNLNSVFCAVNILAAPMAQSRNGRVIIFSACLGRMS